MREPKYVRAQADCCQNGKGRDGIAAFCSFAPAFEGLRDGKGRREGADYAPYAIGGGMVLAIAAAVLIWRISRKRKPHETRTIQSKRERRVVQQGPHPAFMKTMLVQQPKPEYYESYFKSLRSALKPQFGGDAPRIADVLLRILPEEKVVQILGDAGGVECYLGTHKRQVLEMLKSMGLATESNLINLGLKLSE